MKGPLVNLRGVSLGYGRQPVLTGIDLAIEHGAFMAIVGPNGAGKTTLMRGILGLLPTSAGTIEVRTERLGYVPQREHLDAAYPLTVEEVVHMGAYGRLRGLRRLSREDRRFALECLERVHLSEHRGRLFSELSGGQRQRVLIARALLERPLLLMLDEPTSGVDAENQRWILNLLRELAVEGGRVVLLVTHDLSTTREFVKEALLVSAGHVERLPIERVPES